MSVVSGVTLICSLIESDFDDGHDIVETLNRFIHEDGCASHTVFVELSEKYGGHKHPQHYAFCAGINFLQEDEFAKKVMALEWQCPENVILIIQPEDGDTRVFRPEYPK